MTTALLRGLATCVVAGGLLLAGCGGDGDDPAPSGSGTTGAATTGTAPGGPTLAASQEVVDLINGFVADLPDLETIDRTDPTALAAAAASYGDAAGAIEAKVQEVEAHECVEELALQQAGVMSDISDLVEAALDGRLDDVSVITQRIQGFDEPAFEAAKEECKTTVGYKGREDF
ncbi:MAG: hypothetical protein QOD86_270 [Miltoncostaeaceae bacterium]|jgi:hypothetical protein|nr:hypothetical protein [Miltoncostaeaceae bacterium]